MELCQAYLRKLVSPIQVSSTESILVPPAKRSRIFMANCCRMNIFLKELAWFGTFFTFLNFNPFSFLMTDRISLYETLAPCSSKMSYLMTEADVTQLEPFTNLSVDSMTCSFLILWAISFWCSFLRYPESFFMFETRFLMVSFETPKLMVGWE